MWPFKKIKSEPVNLHPVIVATAIYERYWTYRAGEFKGQKSGDYTTHVAMFWTDDTNRRWVSVATKGHLAIKGHEEDQEIVRDIVKWELHAKLPKGSDKVELPEDLRETGTSLYRHLKYNEG